MNQNLFSCEVELSKFLGSIDIIPDAYQAISRTSTTYKFHTSPSGIQILAFNCPNVDYTARFLNREFVFVSSENHKTAVDFISTKVNKLISINKAAVDLFEQYLNLEDIKNKLKLDSPLAITGQGLGGHLAILFALWMQNVIDVKESNSSKNSFKRPICITFGSPLVGDKFLQGAISERPQWKSSFLNVVAKKDYIASLFSSNSDYKPFGTFMFCTESGGHSAFEDQESILAVLDVMASSNDGSMEMYDYGNVLSSIKRKVLYRGVSDQLGRVNMNPLKAGITLQFKEVDVNISNGLIEKMEQKQTRMIKNKKNVYEPTKKLNEMKISMTYMEWYIKSKRSSKGYYDCFKNVPRRDEIEAHQLITHSHLGLNQYWEKIVNEKDLMPQKEGAKLRKRWLYSGNNYRRMIEALDIGKHYKKLEESYKAEQNEMDKKDIAEINEGANTSYFATRPKHYRLLESWLKEDLGDVNPSNGKKEVPNLNDDSCFWAYVEDAKIWLRILKNGSVSSNGNDMERKLEDFMAYVMHSVNGYLVSSDIFLEGSSLMNWWVEYNAYKEGLCNSEFAQYMNSGSYKLYK